MRRSGDGVKAEAVLSWWEGEEVENPEATGRVASLQGRHYFFNFQLEASHGSSS